MLVVDLVDLSPGWVLIMFGINDQMIDLGDLCLFESTSKSIYWQQPIPSTPKIIFAWTLMYDANWIGARFSYDLGGLDCLVDHFAILVLIIGQ